MQNLFDLNQIEKKVFRTTFQDGLLDMYIGLMLVPFIVYTVTEWIPSSFMVILVFLIFYPTLVYLKRKVILPRTGSIKPGTARRKRLSILAVIICVAVAITAALVLATALRGSIVVVFAVFAVLTVLGTGLVAWLLDILKE